MPQMAPIWWTTMFLTFITSFMFMWTIMYFQTNFNPLTTQSKMPTKTQLNWKW